MTNITHHDVKDLLLHPGPFSEFVGIKLRRLVSLELWLQDVATTTVGQKPSMV